MIIAVTDRKISVAEFMAQAEAIASARPDMIILREKDLSEDEYERLAFELSKICERYDVKFCVNSFIGAAAAIGSTRVQLPFSVLVKNSGRLRKFKEIWVSVHSPTEAEEAERMNATHLIYGNVFETSCKPGAKGKGLAELKVICNSAGVPVFAIGGVNEDNVSAVIDAGCTGVCVRSILMGSNDPKTVMCGLRKNMDADHSNGI